MVALALRHRCCHRDAAPAQPQPAPQPNTTGVKELVALFHTMRDTFGETIEAQKKTIAVQKELLAAKDVIRSTKDAVIASKDETIAAMETIIAAKDEAIEAKQEVIGMQIMLIEDMSVK